MRAQRPRHAPGFTVERVLGGERCGQRVRRGGEHGMDRISNRFEHDPARRGNGLLKDDVVPREHLDHGLRMRFPHGRAANDVGKQDGEDAGWYGWPWRQNRGRTRSARPPYEPPEAKLRARMPPPASSQRG